MEPQSKTILTIVVCIVLVLAGGMYYRSQRMIDRPNPALHETAGEEIVCTMEAKECSDGSYVGRTGPNCEFAPCPEPTRVIAPGSPLKEEMEIHCTMDAYQCPDGSWVGRSGPNCQFVCP